MAVVTAMHPTTHIPRGNAPHLPHDAHHVAPVPVKVAVEHPEKVGKPDGVPHDIIGILAYGIAVLAGATLLSWLFVGAWLAVLVGIVGGILLVKNLPKRSTRERRQEAPGNVIEHVIAHEHNHHGDDMKMSEQDPYDTNAPHGSRHV